MEILSAINRSEEPDRMHESATSDRYVQASPSITRLLPESISSVVAQTFRASVHESTHRKAPTVIRKLCSLL